MSQETWLAEIGAVCDELGYGILMVEPGRIDVVPFGSSGIEHITVESHLLSGALLRELLVKRERKPKP